METVKKIIKNRYLGNDTGNNNEYIRSPRIRTVLDNKYRLEVPHDDQFIDEEILNPFRYSITLKGKKMAKSFLSSLNYWYKCPEEIVNSLATDMTIPLNFVLMIDDIQDKSLLRRGHPCAYLIYGIPRVINTSNFVLFHMISDLIDSDTFEIAVSTVELITDAFRGQAMELYWRDNFICPTEEEYKLMAMRKTGNFFLMCIRWLIAYSPEAMDATPLAESIALYFQIFDDYQSLQLSKFQEKKGFCEDITEGKFSFPVIYVINNYPEEGKIVLDILKQRTRDIKQLEYCRSILEKCGALEYTQKAFNKYKEITIRESARFGENPIFQKKVLTSFMGGTSITA